jgi:hypothetical protein
MPPIRTAESRVSTGQAGVRVPNGWRSLTTLGVALCMSTLGLHTPGCAGPSRFTVDKAAWRSARAARRPLPVDVGRGVQRYLRPEFVALAYGYDEDEIAVPDPGLTHRRWGVGSMWTGVGLAGLSTLPFLTAAFMGFGSLGTETAEERRELAEQTSKGEAAGWTLLGTGGVLFLVGGILLAIGHGKADAILLPIGVDPFASEVEADTPSLEPRGPDDVDRRQGRLPSL